VGLSQHVARGNAKAGASTRPWHRMATLRGKTVVPKRSTMSEIAQITRKLLLIGIIQGEPSPAGGGIGNSNLSGRTTLVP
jgi:hypothetical protein